MSLHTVFLFLCVCDVVHTQCHVKQRNVKILLMYRSCKQAYAHSIPTCVTFFLSVPLQRFIYIYIKNRFLLMLHILLLEARLFFHFSVNVCVYLFYYLCVYEYTKHYIVHTHTGLLHRECRSVSCIYLYMTEQKKMRIVVCGMRWMPSK